MLHIQPEVRFFDCDVTFGLGGESLTDLDLEQY